MTNPIIYTDTNFTTSGGAVDPEQLRQEFVAASFPSTPVTFDFIHTVGIGGTLIVEVFFDVIPNATDEATADALIAAHTAAGPTLSQEGKAIGVGEMNGNTNATTITNGGYTAIDVTGTVENAVSEGINLTTAVNGVLTYIVERDITAKLFAALSAIKVGSTQNYRFAISINGAVPVFASAAYTPMEVKTVKVSAITLRPVFLTKGDTIQIMVAGDGTANALTITDFVIDITEV